MDTERTSDGDDGGESGDGWRWVADSARAVMLARAGGAKISKGKLEKLIKARLVKAGVSKKVVDRAAKAKNAVETYKKAMKAQNACAI
jgi:phage-related baseplate assembly protein